MDKATLIRQLGLEPHVEGGYYSRTYTSPWSSTTHTQDGSARERALMSSIYFMLTSDSPIDHWHLNSSDIVHYFHHGLPIKYTLISPEGGCYSIVLGADLTAGHQLQFAAPAGSYKAAELQYTEGPPDYSLISEAVVPGFDYTDWSMATMEDIKRLAPQNWEAHKHLVLK